MHPHDRPPVPPPSERPSGPSGPTPRVTVSADLLAEVGLAGRTDLVWRRSPGKWGDRYLVSNEADVLSLPFTDRAGRKRGAHLLRPHPNGPSGTGYLRLQLYAPDGERWHVSLHKLVALCYLGEPPGPHGVAGGWTVHHEDGNKRSNHVGNLSWQTQATNARLSAARLTEEEVREILRRHASGQTKQSALAEEFGVAASTISNVIRGRTWRHVAMP